MMRTLMLSLVLLASLLAQAVRADGQVPEAGDEVKVTGEVTEQARAHFKLGVDLYRERNYRAALIEFQRAYEAAPHYKLLYNLGQTSLELQEDSRAIEYFNKYLRQGETELTPERRQEVEETIVRLKARLATIVVTSNQQLAEIFVDDSLVGWTPLREPVKLSVGRRTIAARKHGFANVERVVDVAAGDHLRVELQFKEKPVQVEVARNPYPADPQPADSSMSAATWMCITTAGLGAASIGMTVVTALAQKSYDDEKKTLTTRTELEDLREGAKRKALITDIFWSATAVSAVVASVLLISGAGDEREPSSGSQSQVRLDLGPTNLSVRGWF